MPLAAGTKLGPYEILSAIGVGGMGEVYKARDTRLDRIVAIKVLPTHLADRSELRERFEREAKTIASLNHPHICTLYDVGHQDEIEFLVMEYVEGETLAQRLQKGPLQLEQVLQFAIEIADALDKAHRKGITHRDLKPGNVMLTKSGTKLLDFGLAKLKQEVAPAIPDSQLPTMKSAVTAEGTILGTLQYMAPEQVEGKQNEIDARTDIFAFGAVVYEMATGKRAFEGKSSASVMAKVLESEPPSMVSLQPMTPAALDRVVKKCLAKDPEDRWQTARDLQGELKWIAESLTQAAPVPVVSDATKDASTLGRRPFALVGAALLVGAIIAGLVVWKLRPAPASQPVSHLIVSLPVDERLAVIGAQGPMVALSPDGTHIAYIGMQHGIQQVFLRSMDSLEARPVAGTEEAVAPFFSPDGQWLGFFADGKLKKVSMSGGATLTLCDAPSPRGASWGSNDVIVFVPGNNVGLFQVSAAGGTPQALTTLKQGENSHRWPEFLPDGKTVLFAVNGVGGINDDAQIAVQRLDARERHDLIRGGSYPHYVSTGHLVYYRAGTMMAVPFDAERLEVHGTPAPAFEGVMASNNGAAQFSFSRAGSLIYVPGTAQALQLTLAWVNRNGTEQPLSAPPHLYRYPRIASDGKRVAVVIQENGTQVWIYDLARGTLSRLTFQGGSVPAWTSDGKRVSFQVGDDVFWQPADGSGKAEQLITGRPGASATSFSADGQFLAFTEDNPTTGPDLWVMRLADHKAQPFLRTPFEERAEYFSPDGHWLAYVSNESGRREIFVQPYPGPGGKWQISTEGGNEPTWSHNGREIFYRNGDKMMAVDITTQPVFAAGTPKVLFEKRYVAPTLSSPNYDVSPDGQRFLMVKDSEATTSAAQVNVVLNWSEELKRRVPTGTK